MNFNQNGLLEVEQVALLLMLCVEVLIKVSFIDSCFTSCFTSMDFVLDPSNSIIKRWGCTLF